MAGPNPYFFDPNEGVSSAANQGSDPSTAPLTSANGANSWYSPMPPDPVGASPNKPGEKKPVQTMTYNTIDGKPPKDSCWGYGNSFFEQEAIGAKEEKPYNRNMWFEGTTVNTAMRPQTMCIADAKGYLQLTISGPTGPVDGNKVEIGPGEAVEVIWVAYGASSVTVDGESVGVDGVQVFSFDKHILGHVSPKRLVKIVAKFSDRNPITSVLEIKMVPEAIGTLREWRAQHQVEWKKPGFLRYFELVVQLRGELSYNPKRKGEYLTVGASARISRDAIEGVGVFAFDAGPWMGFEKSKIEINVGGRIKLKDGKERIAVEIKRAASSPVSTLLEGDHYKIEVLSDFEAIGTVVSFERPPNGAWEFPKIGVIAVAGSATLKGTITYNEYSFEVSGKIKLQGSVSVDWVAVFKDLLSDAALAVLIPVAIVVGAIATIAINVGNLIAIWDLEDMRDIKIPSLANITMNGFIEGLRGMGGDATAYTIKDEASAHLAGLAKGTTERARIFKEIRENRRHEDEVAGRASEDDSVDIPTFDVWMAKNRSTIEADGKRDITNRIKQEVWAALADGYMKSPLWDIDMLRDNAVAILNKQMWAWRFIIGGTSPAYLKGEWLELWDKHCVKNTGVPYVQEGNF